MFLMECGIVLICDVLFFLLVLVGFLCFIYIIFVDEIFFFLIDFIYVFILKVFFRWRFEKNIE